MFIGDFMRLSIKKVSSLKITKAKKKAYYKGMWQTAMYKLNYGQYSSQTQRNALIKQVKFSETKLKGR